MNYQHCLQIAVGNAVCYSGFREGQRPGEFFPTYEQVKEDLLIIQEHWQYIRLYSCDNHALTVLDVIEKEKLPIKVMLGAFIEAEINNPNCPWGAEYLVMKNWSMLKSLSLILLFGQQISLSGGSVCLCF